MRKSIGLAVVACATGFFISTIVQAATGNWVGPTSTGWSDPAHWQVGTIPNAQGDVAQYTTGASQIALNDVAGGVTVGTLKVLGVANSSMQFTPNNSIFLNQDGAGPLSASVINDIQSTQVSGTPPTVQTGNPAIFLNAPASPNTGTFVLQDDLFISNTSNSTRTSGSVQIRGSITGAGNITIENISNDIGHGQVAFTQSESGAGNGFSGNVTIAKGAVTFTRGDIFTPSPGNFVTIGAAGKGDATLAAVGNGLGNIENSFNVAAGTGGTSIFAANATNGANPGTANIQIKSTNTNASFITLNGDVSFDNRNTAGSIFIIGDPIQGVGKVTKIGAGPLEITNAGTYSGGTVVANGSLNVRHADEIGSIFGFYAATNGTLGTGDVTVNSTPATSAATTKLLIDTSVAGINVIADTATVRLAGCDSAFAGCSTGVAGLADGGHMELGAGVNETIAKLMLSSDNGVNFVAQAPGSYGATGSGATHILDEYFAGAGILTVVPVGLPGDYNNDGKVDAADYVLWRQNPEAHGNDPGGYNTWRANFGAGPGAGSGLGSGNQAVPEPSTLLLVLAGVLLAGVARRGR